MAINVFSEMKRAISPEVVANLPDELKKHIVEVCTTLEHSMVPRVTWICETNMKTASKRATKYMTIY